MKTEYILAISSPKEFYFCSVPVTEKPVITLPGSMSFEFINFKKFLGELIEHFPGTIRDLAARVNTQPAYIFMFAQTNPAKQKPLPAFPDLVEFTTMVELIKLYYKYVIAKPS